MTKWSPLLITLYGGLKMNNFDFLFKSINTFLAQFYLKTLKKPQIWPPPPPTRLN